MGSVVRERSEAMKKSNVGIPKFTNEDEEAKWWASAEGREFLKRQSLGGCLKAKRDRHSCGASDDGRKGDPVV
jgi:hypothetical protein